MIITFSGERAYRHLEKLAVEIGPRNSGSEGERRASEYIASEFRALGLETRLQEFEVDTGRALVETLEVLEPYRKAVACKALPLAGGTGPEGVEGELVYLDAVAEEYLTPEVDGKIIMTQGFYRKGLELFDMIRPLGVISIGRRPRSPLFHGWGTAKLRDRYGPMPIVNVTFEDGLELLESGAKRVRLVAVVEAERARSQNVVGELRGSLKPEEIVIVGGHYDTVPDILGASDNAAGTAIAMELARVFKKNGTKRTMRFFAWGCEESGCVGSAHDASRLKREADELKERDPDTKTELDRIRLIVNADVHGGRIGSNTAAALGPVELKSSVKLLAKETGVVFNMGGSGPGITAGVYSSDGTSYSSVGIPSLNFIRSGAPFIHSTEDSVRWLSPGALEVQGAFIERFLTRYVAEAAVFPFERTIPEDDKKALEGWYKDRMAKPPGAD